MKTMANIIDSMSTTEIDDEGMTNNNDTHTTHHDHDNNHKHNNTKAHANTHGKARNQSIESKTVNINMNAKTDRHNSVTN